MSVGQADVYRVIDSETQVGLSDCVIYTDGQLSLSNEDGRFNMDFKDSVVIQHLGYQTGVFHSDTSIYELQKLSVDLEEIVIVSRSYEDILYSAIQSLRDNMDEFLAENNTFKYELAHRDFDMTALIAIDPSYKLGAFQVYNASFDWKNSQLDTMKARPLIPLTYSLGLMPSLSFKSKFYSRRHAKKKFKILHVEPCDSTGSIIYQVKYKKDFVRFEIDEYHQIVDIQTFYDADLTELYTHLTFENEIPTSIKEFGHAEAKYNWELKPIPNLSFIYSSNKYSGTRALKDLKFDRLNLIE